MPQLDIVTFHFQILGTVLMFLTVFFFNIWLILPFFFINIKIKYQLYSFFLNEIFKIKISLKKFINFFNFNFIYLLNKFLIIIKMFKLKLINIKIFYILNLHKFLEKKLFDKFFKKILIFLTLNDYINRKIKKFLNYSNIFNIFLKKLLINSKIKKNIKKKYIYTTFSTKTLKFKKNLKK